MGFFASLFGGSKLQARLDVAERRNRALHSAIVAANASKGGGAWPGTNEEYFNQEYLEALSAVLKKSQDLDVNNPDVRGFHRTRVAQIIGAGVAFKAAQRFDELGLDKAELEGIRAQLDRLRELHSELGGFDSTGKGRSEGKQQERALLTMLVCGSCLIHRVWGGDPALPLPLSLELIPGSRISTPFEKAADPLISYGIAYADEHRSRVVGYYVRRVPMSRGNSFIPDYSWDYIPAEDAVLLELTEIAGLDRALPLSVANVRMLRNRGEFVESAVQAARAQAKVYANTECAEGVDPWNAAADDRGTAQSEAAPNGFVELGGVQMLYSQHGEKVNWNSARLPDPDFSGFMDQTDARLARGFVSSLSRFTRKVNSSWAGGRLEDQQDDPIIDQYRVSFLSAWRVVNTWFIEAVWLCNAVRLPGYSTATRALWSRHRAQFPGKVHINPVDTAKARQIGYGLRTLTPQMACEEDGKDLASNLAQWAEAIALARKAEALHGLPEGTLDYLLEGTQTPADAGEEEKQNAEAGVTDPEPAKQGRMRLAGGGQ